MRIKSLGFLLTLLVLFSSSFVVYGQNHFFIDVPSNHWAQTSIKRLVDLEVIKQAEQFGLGKQVSTNEMIQMLRKLDANLEWEMHLNDMTPSETPLKRVDAINLLIKAFNYNELANYLMHKEVPFKDVTQDKGAVLLAYQFGWITMNDQKMFRPNDWITREEMVVLLDRVYDEPLKTLHAYYAIQSFHQIDLTTDLTDISYGWSRLELNANNEVVLNTTAQNNNEYHVPRGANEAIKTISQNEINQYLMVFVQERLVWSEVDKKNISLAEYILSTPKTRKTAVDQMVQGLLDLREKTSVAGVLVDFEGLKGKKNADNLNAFLELLRAEASVLNFEILTAVHPARSNNQAYFDGYDFKTIGDLSDKVILMAHDYEPKRLTTFEMEAGLTITPLAPMNEVYDAIDAILDPDTGVADSNKVILQLSMDSAQWKLKEGKIIHSVPYRPRYGAILSRIENGGIVTYSERFQSPRLVFEDTTDGTRNVIWYENAQSIEAKVRLARSLGLGGVSVWRLGTIPLFDHYPDENLNLWEAILKYYQ